MNGEIDAPRVRLDLTSRPEAARLVRSMSTATGEALGLDEELQGDVNTAVSEACNNVIVHAYGEREGPFWVELVGGPDGVAVRVRDYGRGICENEPDVDGLQVGLALMSAVADRSEFTSVPDGGTDVRLWFRGAAADSFPAAGERTVAEERGELASPAMPVHPDLAPGADAILTVAPVQLLGPVLGRLGRALAPNAGFSLDRCSDVYLLADALGAHVAGAADGASISVALGVRGRRLEFTLAPLRTGTSSRLNGRRPEIQPETIAWLTDELTVSQADGHETLHVAMLSRS